jgi:hypothetical protein
MSIYANDTNKLDAEPNCVEIHGTLSFSFRPDFRSQSRGILDLGFAARIARGSIITATLNLIVVLSGLGWMRFSWVIGCLGGVVDHL